MDTGIQANFKDGDVLVNVYGATGPAFLEHLDYLIGIADKIKNADQVLKGNALAFTPDPDPMGLIRSELGGVVIAEYDPATPPMPAPVQAAPAAYPPSWPQPQVTQPVAPVAQPAPFGASTYCQRCRMAPICKTCNQPAQPIPKSVKNGQYWIHECPSGNREHKGQWCNEPKA